MHCAKLPILREFKKNDFLLKLLVLLVVLFTCSKLFPLYSQQIKTVVIDAGHGGKDPGCHGNFAFEKDVCLSMALKLGSLIKAKYPEIKIIYTQRHIFHLHKKPLTPKIRFEPLHESFFLH